MTCEPRKFEREKRQGQVVSPLHQRLDLWINVVLEHLPRRIIWQECILVREILLDWMGQFLSQIGIIAAAFR
jgi:hypothetical protein